MHQLRLCFYLQIIVQTDRRSLSVNNSLVFWGKHINIYTHTYSSSIMLFIPNAGAFFSKKEHTLCKWTSCVSTSAYAWHNYLHRKWWNMYNTCTNRPHSQKAVWHWDCGGDLEHNTQSRKRILFNCVSFSPWHSYGTTGRESLTFAALFSTTKITNTRTEWSRHRCDRVSLYVGTTCICVYM